MGDKKWAKSGNGPDWTDLEPIIRAIQNLYGCATTVVISARGIGATGGYDVKIISIFETVPGSEERAAVVTESSWPCPDCATLEGHIYGGLWRHDFDIGLAHQQESLWAAEPPPAQ